jgi:cold shock CspA family protein/ribosome-associated translation inhibitor RaiA
MQRALQLIWHDVDPSDTLAAHVREEVSHLERFHPRITGCTVTLEAPSQHHRHAGNRYRVRIELTVPGRKIVVGRDPQKSWTHADLYLAVKGAFREAQRQLADHVRRIDGRVKVHAAPARAVVARVLPDDGYGFLRTEDEREIYFHARSVLGGRFGALRAGDAVRFVEEAGDEGPQASTVAPLHPRRLAARVLSGSEPS